MSQYSGGTWIGRKVAQVLLLFVFAHSAVLAQEGVAKPEKKGFLDRVFGQRKKAMMVKSIGNAKQIYLLMFEFDADYGEFPSDKTAGFDKDLNGYKGKFSNDYLGQLFAGGYIKSEEIFYAEGGSQKDKKPDNEFETKAKTLEAGECGFTYVMGQSTSKHTGRPLLCTPMTGEGVKFDPKPYNGKAVVLRIDGAVKIYTINKDGKVILPNGKGLFENGVDTAWGKDGFKKEMLAFPK